MGSSFLSQNINPANMALIRSGVWEQFTNSLSGDSVTPDASSYNFFDIYLDRPTTRINMPAGGIPGQPIRFQLRQDGTGGRAVKWGDIVENSGLTCTIAKGADPSITITITSGTFDWSKLSAISARRSFLQMSGWAQNAMNISNIRITAFDESAGTITFSCDWYDSISNVVGDTGVTINYENPFYFEDEQGETWHSQEPYKVTLYEYFDSSADGSGMLMKIGTYSNSPGGCMHTSVRDEEYLADDFINGSDNGLLNWREANSNGTTAQTSSSTYLTENHPGLLYQRLNSGSTSARTITTLGIDTFILENMRVGIEGIVCVGTPGFADAGVNYYFGWQDTNNSFDASNEGAHFKIVSDGTVGRLWCILQSGGVDTTYDTGIDLDPATWYVLRIGKSSNNTKIKFSLNDVIVYLGDIADMDVTARMTCGFGQYYSGSALGANREWYLDAFAIKYRLNADRI